MNTVNCLWIDDLRTPPEGWVWAKTSAEAIELLSAQDERFDFISFDHDLGGDDTSRKVVLWLCENTSKWPQEAAVHSRNPVGKDWLLGMIERYGEGCRLRRY